MMISYLATATLAVGMLAAAPKPLDWEPSYGKALEATRAGQDPLLVVLDKPGSEDARIEPEFLNKDEVGGEQVKLLRPYRLCHVDVSTDYGQKVADAFQAKSFPHVAIIDKTGSMVIFRKSGKIQEDEWAKILTKHKNGERPAATAVSRVSYKPTGKSSSSASRPYCPNCQRTQF
jgi:hypothetical protein